MVKCMRISTLKTVCHHRSPVLPLYRSHMESFSLLYTYLTLFACIISLKSAFKTFSLNLRAAGVAQQVHPLPAAHAWLCSQVHVPAAQLFVHYPASDLRISRGWPKSLGTHTCMGDTEDTAGSDLRSLQH